MAVRNADFFSGNNFPLEAGRKFKSKFWRKKEITKKMQDWLKRFGVEFAEDIFMELDYKFGCYYVCETLEELKRCFLYGNWAIRQGFIYESLAFLNQINGGDEWWTIKKFPDGEIVAFESCTMIRIIKNNPECYFEDYIAQMLKATKEQCRKLEYCDEEFDKKYERKEALGGA